MDDMPLRRSHRQCRQRVLRLNLHVRTLCLRNRRSAGQRPTPLTLPGKPMKRAGRVCLPRWEASTLRSDATPLRCLAAVYGKGLLSSADAKGACARMGTSDPLSSPATAAPVIDRVRQGWAQSGVLDAGDDKRVAACKDCSLGPPPALHITAAHLAEAVEARSQDSTAREQGEPHDRYASGQMALTMLSQRAQDRLPVLIQVAGHAQPLRAFRQAWSPPCTIWSLQVCIERMFEGSTPTIRWLDWRVSATNLPAASAELAQAAPASRDGSLVKRADHCVGLARQRQVEVLAGRYMGNPQRSTLRPIGARLPETFQVITQATVPRLTSGLYRPGAKRGLCTNVERQRGRT
jgi:hypothetical protein